MCFLASSKLLPRTITNSLSQTPLQPSSSGQKLQSSGTPAITGKLTASDFIRHSRRSGLNLLEPRVVELMRPSSSHLTIASSSLACSTVPEFSSRFSEVTQTLDAISGIEFLVGTRGLARAAASWHGLSQALRRGMTRAVGESGAVWVSAYWRYGS